MLKKILLGIGGLLLVVVLGAGAFVMAQVSAYDASMSKKWDFPIPDVKIPNDPETLARGKHLTEALGGCTGCHGDNMGGGKVEDLGPLGKIVHYNVTSGKGGRLAEYTDGELARLLRHGVKKDGTSANLMPVQEFSWWPDSDRAAVIAYMRSLPPVDGQPGSVEVSTFAKVLDRMDAIPLDTTRRVNHDEKPAEITPAPTVEYGQRIANLCFGCHNEKLTGGPIPGTPPNFGTPKNLTPHESGLKGWTFDDFKKVVTSGVKRDGTPLSEFMPVVAFRNFNDTEMQALWAYLQSLPPRPMGEK